MRISATWKPAALLLAVVATGLAPDERLAFAQNPQTARQQEQDQPYLIYVKGIT